MRRLGAGELLRIGGLPSKRMLSGSSLLLEGATTSPTTTPVSRERALETWYPQLKAKVAPKAHRVVDAFDSAGATSTSTTDKHPLPPSEMSVFTKLRSLFGASPTGASPPTQGAPASSPYRSEATDNTTDAPLPKADDSQGGVPWSCHERMDFYFSFWAPQGWVVREMVRENFISIQISPPTTSASGSGPPSSSPPPSAPVHGISITAFAYHKKVKHPDSGALLRSFVKRFSTQVDPNLRLVQFYDEGAEAAAAATPENTKDATPKEKEVASSTSVAHEIGRQIGGSVCEVSFSPRAGPTSPQRNSALGVCRAFYHPNGRFHYVVLAAVPSEEFQVVSDQVKYAVMATRETMSPVADSS